LPVSVGISAIVNIALNFALIPILGYWGAAWASLVAYFVSAVYYIIIREEFTQYNMNGSDY